MSTRVVFRDSRGREGVLELRPEHGASIGRGLDCAIRTDDGMVSRLHAELRFESGGWWIDDKGSANGTTVNQVKVAKQALHHRDIIQCGSLTLRFLEEDEAQPAQVAPDQPSVAKPPERGVQRMSMPPPIAAAADEPVPPVKPALRPKRATAQLASGESNPPPLALGGTAGLPYGGPPSHAPGLVSGRIPSIVVEEGYERSAPVEQEATAAPSAAGGYGESGSAGAGAGKLAQALEALQDKHDREVADSKRLRAEISTLRDRHEEFKQQLARRDELLAAEQTVAEELRADIEQAKAEVQAAAKAERAAREALGAHEHAAKRATADLAAARAEIEAMRSQLAEARRAKDEGYNEVNEQVREIERLREVIGEQERMLEERRIALVTLEGTLQEQRADKDKQLAAAAKLRAEAAAAAEHAAASAAQVVQLEQDKARLEHAHTELASKLAAQAAGRASAGVGDSAANDVDDQGYAEIVSRLSDELRSLRIAHSALEQAKDAVDRQLAAAQAEVAVQAVLLAEKAEAEAAAMAAAAAAEKALAARSSADKDAFGEEAAATGVFGTEAMMALISRVVEATEIVNDALSELRSQARLVAEELQTGGDAAVAREAAQGMIETVEVIKASLRELRSSAEEAS